MEGIGFLLAGLGIGVFLYFLGLSKDRPKAKALIETERKKDEATRSHDTAIARRAERERKLISKELANESKQAIVRRFLRSFSKPPHYDE